MDQTISRAKNTLHTPEKQIRKFVEACDIGASLFTMEFNTGSYCGDRAGHGHTFGNQKIHKSGNKKQ